MILDARSKRIQTALLLLLLGLVMAVLVPVGMRMWDALGTKQPDLAYISDYTKIVFPSDAQLIGSHSMGGPDRSITAVVRIERKDVPRFISDLRKTNHTEEQDLQGAAVNVSSDSPVWWDLGSARKLRCFYVKPKSTEYSDTRCDVFVREDDPHFAYIYLDGLLY